jgi:hypothetical protein
LDFEFVLQLLLELLDDHGTGSVLFFIFRSCEVLRAEVLIIERRKKILFRLITVTVNVFDQRLGVSLVALENSRMFRGLGGRIEGIAGVLVVEIVRMMEEG